MYVAPETCPFLPPHRSKGQNGDTNYTMARFALVFHSNQSLSQEFTRMQKILWITVIKATIFTRIHINNNSCDFLNVMRIVPNTCDFFLLL